MVSIIFDTKTMILAFDTETTGLPLCQPDGHILEPHITQLSAILYSIQEQRVIHMLNSYIRLEADVEISPKAQLISGITPELCQEKGRPIHQVLMDFYRLYRLCNVLVAHNYDFDCARIRCEIQRMVQSRPKLPLYHDMFPIIPCKNILCTMKAPLNQIKGRWPKLIDLYRRLFGYSVDANSLHHSFVDSVLCLRVLLKTQYHVTVPDTEFEQWVNLFQVREPTTPSSVRIVPWRMCRMGETKFSP